MATAAERPWWYVGGAVLFRTGADAVQAKRDTPVFLRAVVRSQNRARQQENR